MKIGVFFGNPETTTGGNALKFYASVRIEVRRAAQLKKDDRVIGNRVKAKIVKNKVAPPFRNTEFDIMYNEGISVTGDLIDTGVLWNVVAKNGNSYSFDEVKLGVGREASKLFLKEHPEVFEDIRKELFAAVRAKEAEENDSSSSSSASTPAPVATEE
jgi:recombination protein RecA